MMDPKGLFPPPPHEGPPLPSGLRVGWPLTVDEVERAVTNYRESAERAAYNYRISMERRVANYRTALLQKLPKGPIG